MTYFLDNPIYFRVLTMCNTFIEINAAYFYFLL